MHGKQKYREAGYSNTLPPPPPPPLLLKLPWRESALSHTNGYSIAEILLVFGIIAGVLIGVWAMYTMLAEETDVQNAIAEILVIRDAAVQWKMANGNQWRGADWNSDSRGTPVNRVRLDRIAPYASKAIKYTSETKDGGGATEVEGFNIFGGHILIGLNGDNATIAYGSFRDIQICARVLSYFGEIEQQEGATGTSTEIRIPPGKAIYGYVGSNTATLAGCRKDGSGGSGGPSSYVLYLLID